MSEAEHKKRKENKNGKNNNSEEINTSFRQLCITENCIQVTAWVLLTLGLCIIVTTFFLGNYAVDNNNSEVLKFANNDNIDGFMELSKTPRTKPGSTFGVDSGIADGCEETFCKISCINAVDIFSELNKIFHLSNCTSTDVLVIKNQQFPRATLKNSWTLVDLYIHEIIITSSNVTKILSNAFNSPLFSRTFSLSLHGLHLEMVGSGALLGLHSLKILDIHSKISKLDRAFFQPIQSTITHITLNAGMTIAKNESIFGIGHFEKLEYADLSDNFFTGPLTKNTFASTPNINYLYIRNSKITAVTADAFIHLAGKLYILNLSENLLTTISSNVLSPLLNANTRAFISLGMNNWLCNCDIVSLARIYTSHRNQFLDSLYCKAPHKLYGKFLNELNLTQYDMATSTTSDIVNEIDDLTIPTTPQSTNNWSIVVDEQKNLNLNSRHEDDTVLKIRCSNALFPNATRSLSGFDDVLSSDLLSSDKYITENLKMNYNGKNGKIFRFKSPTNLLSLKLFENRSVEIVVEDFSEADETNIIWFSDNFDDLQVKYMSKSIDYKCYGYDTPFFVHDLIENATYTFCIMNAREPSITPFNCLPLHVPLVVKSTDNIWISEDNRQLTVAIMCLIFMLSTFVGAVIAYFGIKTYPDLLEGSRNVLVVKKCDKSSYISTICESEYLQKSSLKKKTSLRDTNSKGKLVSSSPLFGFSVKNLERLSSEQSSSTCFEESFVPMSFLEDEYEMPKISEHYHLCSERCIPNNYATSPSIPPPLPKRNSNILDEKQSLNT